MSAGAVAAARRPPPAASAAPAAACLRKSRRPMLSRFASDMAESPLKEFIHGTADLFSAPVGLSSRRHPMKANRWNLGHFRAKSSPPDEALSSPAWPLPECGGAGSGYCGASPQGAPGLQQGGAYRKAKADDTDAYDTRERLARSPAHRGGVMKNDEPLSRRAFLRGSIGTAAGLGATSLLLHPSTSSAARAGPRRRPNVLFIITDDQHLDTFGEFKPK